MNRTGLVVLLAASLLFAVERPQPMEDKKPVDVQRSFLGTKFRQDGHLLQPGSMYEVLGRYPKAKDAVSAAKLWMYPGMVFGAAGGFLMGYTAVQPVFGREFNAPVFFAGLGSVAVAVAFGKISESKLVHAVEAYNGIQGRTGFQLRLGPEAAGLIVTYRFPAGG